MKKKLIIASIILSIAIVLVLMVALIEKKNNVVTPKKMNKDFTYIGQDYYQRDEIKIFKSYEELASKFPTNNVDKNSFNDYDYVLIQIRYDSCGEEDIKPVGYKFKNNKVIVDVQYKNNCGGPCPIEYLNYVLKVEKGTTIDDVEFNYENLSTKECNDDPNIVKKPIIYLYPEETTNVIVKLGFPEKLTTSYPKYNNNWNVTAKSDGTLIDNNTNRELYGLYWEGTDNGVKQTNEGFVVKGEDTAQFLEEKLSILGLNDKEAEEFIIYWLPVLEKNNYNYIRFSTQDEINEYMPLEVTPTPDTTIRVLMNYKLLTHKIKVKEQQLTKQERTGFTLVEWGGSKIK